MGVVSKSEPLQAVVHAVRTVAAGEPFLSSEEAAAIDGRRASLRPQLSTRELQALTLFAGGMPIKSVARRMDVSQDTVKAYLVRARKKYFDLNRPAGTKLELYKRAVEDGFLRPPRVG
jgi:DNA-binding NarL/FixJ family response regulator